MANLLMLRCNVCGQPLGNFSSQCSRYECQSCQHVYIFEQGILHCLRFADSQVSADVAADKLSSFAHSSEETRSVANARLDSLFARALSSPGTADRMLLDVGCGFGDIMSSAAPQFDFVVGINIEYEELQHARARLSQLGFANTLLVHASAQELPFMPVQFRVVTCIQVLEHVREPKRVVGQLKQMLTPQGLLFLSVPNRYTLRPEPHTQLHGVGYLPRRMARWYAARCGRLNEFESVNFLSTSQITEWLQSEFGSSFEFIRSGSHNSFLGQMARRTWRVPIASFMARELVGDIEALAWQ